MHASEAERVPQFLPPPFARSDYRDTGRLVEVHLRSALRLFVSVRCKRTMPPKRKRGASESEGPGPLLGRFGTSLKCGIVGLPNVG